MPTDPNTLLRNARDRRAEAQERWHRLEAQLINGEVDDDKREAHIAACREAEAEVREADEAIDRIERMHKLGFHSDKAEPPIELDEKDVRKYSLSRLILARANVSDRNPRDVAGFEMEIADEIQKRSPRQSDGVWIPRGLLQREARTLIAADGSQGGYFVDDEISSNLIGLLRPASVLARLNIIRMDGLSGNVYIPKHTGAGTAYWVEGEEDTITESQQTIGQTELRPHHMGSHTKYSRQLLVQQSIDVEAFIRNDLARVMAIEMDRVSLYGSGVGGEPQGLKNTTGLNDPANFAGATPTWAELMTMVGECALDNALPNFGGGEDGGGGTGSIAWLIEGQMASNLLAANKDAGSGQFILEAVGAAGGRIGLYPVAISNTVANGDVWFGDFSNMIWASWGDIDLIVNPYTHDQSGVIRLTAHNFVDTAVRHIEAFCYNT